MTYDRYGRRKSRGKIILLILGMAVYIYAAYLTYDKFYIQPSYEVVLQERKVLSLVGSWKAVERCNGMSIPLRFAFEDNGMFTRYMGAIRESGRWSIEEEKYLILDFTAYKFVYEVNQHTLYAINRSNERIPNCRIDLEPV